VNHLNVTLIAGATVPSSDGHQRRMQWSH